MLSLSDVVLRHANTDAPLGFEYKAFQVGNRSNLQPWSANQQAFVIDQKFRIAAEFYQPMRLNTRYDPFWALPWQGDFPDGFPLPGLGAAILVHEGATKDCGGGIFEIERQFATIPLTRNESEQFVINRIGLTINSAEYLRSPIAVMSRIQFDYFVYDEINILSDIPLFTNLAAVGIRLNAETGMRPQGILIDAMKFYGANEFQEVPAIYDQPADGSIPASTPSMTDYQGFMDGGSGTSNGLRAEMVVEASTFNRYKGNILERKTRFAEIQ
jgi:hypothetical protein